MLKYVKNVRHTSQNIMHNKLHSVIIWYLFVWLFENWINNAVPKGKFIYKIIKRIKYILEEILLNLTYITIKRNCMTYEVS